jgi:hypothetical protein
MPTEAEPASTPRPSGSTTGRLTMLRRGSPTRNFLRHYGEMVIAMFLGMLVLGLPLLGLVGLLGVSTTEMEDRAPAVVLLGMPVVMTIPMVAWMRYRGHAWRPSMEMAAAMFVPSFGAIGLMAIGASDFDSALVIEHVAMLLSMLALMLFRWNEYATTDRDRALAVANADAQVETSA